MTFDEWLTSTQARRDALTAYGKTGVPPGEEERALDSLRAIGFTHEAAEFLSQAGAHLKHLREKAMWAARKDHPELTSREREIVEKSAVRDIQQVVDACEIAWYSCKSRYYHHNGH